MNLNSCQTLSIFIKRSSIASNLARARDLQYKMGIKKSLRLFGFLVV